MTTDREKLEAIRAVAEGLAASQTWEQNFSVGERILSILSSPDSGAGEVERVRAALSRLEDSILHHMIERDGWTPQDECYREVVESVVREIVAASPESEGAKLGGELLAAVLELFYYSGECMPKWRLRAALANAGIIPSSYAPRPAPIEPARGEDASHKYDGRPDDSACRRVLSDGRPCWMGQEHSIHRPPAAPPAPEPVRPKPTRPLPPAFGSREYFDEMADDLASENGPAPERGEGRCEQCYHTHTGPCDGDFGNCWCGHP